MKLERDTLNGRRTGKDRRRQKGGGSAHFPDDLVSASSLVDLFAETIRRGGKGELNNMFRDKAVRLLVGSSLPDAALSAVMSAAVFRIAGTEGCASHMPAERKSLVNLFGRSPPPRVKQPKEMRDHKDVARAVFATMPAAEIDIEIHSSVERLSSAWRHFPLPRHHWARGGFTLSRSDQGPAGIKAAFHTAQYVKEVAAATEAACVQGRRGGRRPPKNLRVSHFLG